MGAGRPFGTFKYTSVEDLERDINKYFDNQDKADKPYTLEGLSLALDITPQTLCNYGSVNYAEGKYFDAVNRARIRCVNYASERLYDKNGSNGAKFYLTNNAERMGGLRYADRQEMALAPAEEVDPEALDKRINELLAKLKPDD